MHTDIQTLLKSITPFPLLIDNNIILEGKLVARPLMCQTCQQRECFNPSFNQKYCSLGFRIYDLELPHQQCKFIGVLTSINRKKFSHTLQQRFATKIFEEKVFENWAVHIKDTITFIQQTIRNKQQDYINGFHDITPTINLILRNAEKAINLSNGSTIDEKFENSPEYAQTIYKSAGLLKQHLDFMGYLSNPESIRYGNKHSTGIYKLIDMISRIAKQAAAQRHINIKLEGTSFNKPKIYDSLATLFFILLDNAIKYSYENQDIIITIQDIPNNAVSVDFMSYGPIIPSAESIKVFEKYYRYIHPSLDSEKIKGHGFGLYIAKLISNKHGFDIQYRSSLSSIEKNNTQIGENHFFFEIPSDTPD